MSSCKNVLELSKSHSEDIKKGADFPYGVGMRGGGVNQHMEDSICFLKILFENFLKSLFSLNNGMEFYIQISFLL